METHKHGLSYVAHMQSRRFPKISAQWSMDKYYLNYCQLKNWKLTFVSDDEVNYFNDNISYLVYKITPNVDKYLILLK